MVRVIRVFLYCVVVMAIVYSGDMTGVVRDASGKPVAAVFVSARDLESGDTLDVTVSSQVELSEVLARREKANVPFLKFLDEPTMRMFVYHLPRNGVDKQAPHQYDEVYYVVRGKATLTVGDTTHHVKAGSLVFVKAEADHRFQDITEDLDVVVFFSIQPK